MDFQYGWKMENNLGIAIQAKIPVSVWLSTIDLYLELPGPDSFRYGLGVEAGWTAGGYAIVTYYPKNSCYLSFTARVMSVVGNPVIDDTAGAEHAPVMFNP